MVVSVLLTVTLKSSLVCVPTTRTVNPWMIPFLSSGGGGTQVTTTDVAFIAVTLTLVGASLGSMQNKKLHHRMVFPETTSLATKANSSITSRLLESLGGYIIKISTCIT